MTKTYIAPKDKVLLVDKKLTGANTWADYASSDAGKVPRIAETTSGSGVYTLQLLEPSAGSVAWGNVTAKPFDSIGSGLKVIDVTESGSTVHKLTAEYQLHFVKYASRSDLPTAGADYAQVIALVPMSTTETDNVFEEYACVKTSGESVTPETWAWELLGSLKASITQTKDKITVNGTDVQFASYTDATTYTCGVVSGADYNSFKNKQDAISKSATTDVPEAIVSTNTDGTVAKRKIVLVGTDVASTETGLTSAKAVYEYTVKKDTSSNVDFTVGCDAGGPYIDY